MKAPSPAADAPATSAGVAAATAATDGDGAMSLEEFQGLWLEMARSRMVDHFQHLDADGDGKITRAEYDRPFDYAMTRMDRNEDGAVSMRELRKRHHRYKDYDDDEDDD